MSDVLRGPSEAPAPARSEAPPHRTVLLLVEFDGTGFAGWQTQLNQRTVQQVLSEALETMTRHRVVARASSRTDAGVHALAMPVTFDTTVDIPPRGFQRGLNARLPPDVAIRRAREAPPGWRPRDAAVAKTYRYRWLAGPSRRPLERRDRWDVRRPLDVDAMRQGAKQLVGDFDFSSFRSSSCVARTTQRRMYRVDVESAEGRGAELPLGFDSAQGEDGADDKDDGVWQLGSIVVTGNAFLQHMVRILAGTLVEVGRGRRPPGWVGEVLAARDRSLAGPTAPPHGLTLERVHFTGYPRVGK